MKKLFFKLFIRIYGYPCRPHIRLALEQRHDYDSLLWRIGMLYVCGDSIPDISNRNECTRERVRMILAKLARGVKL
jgi:hypothetical protein